MWWPKRHLFIKNMFKNKICVFPKHFASTHFYEEMLTSRQRFLIVLTCSWVFWPKMIPNEYEITSKSKFWTRNVRNLTKSRHLGYRADRVSPRRFPPSFTEHLHVPSRNAQKNQRSELSHTVDIKSHLDPKQWIIGLMFPHRKTISISRQILTFRRILTFRKKS